MPGVAHFQPAKPASRRLRGFAIDPSLATKLETASVSQVILAVPWERLEPGPVGEYLEVIDYDPASNCYYAPVNLEDPRLLAQDGLAPSEGTPQFHQQMTYAIASLTIRNFEMALGRKTLWRPGPAPGGKNKKNDSVFVQRLRIYPHALREPNAYYSPQKIGLLFGYFKASADDRADHMPGSMVFTCLSHDIVAHETTHALLDGMSRSFLMPTNPDVLAFHEAFADIVALFQHFTFPEILRHQISATGGNIRSHQNFLGELAGQFGHGTGMRQALRSAIGEFDDNGVWTPHVPSPDEYDQATEPHSRGSILVAAVFDAFLSIYERRTADLLRLATGGSGILQSGAIHPDLVSRLATEAAKSAQHVLNMCIRALDYCPPVDITFGEFLRAIITADFDLVPNDDLGYRVSFVEAFRRRGLYSKDLRTLGVDSLIWRGPDNDQLKPSKALSDILASLRNYSLVSIYTESRKETFHFEREMRKGVHECLDEHFQKHPQGANDMAYLGLAPGKKFEVRSVRFAFRTSPDNEMLPQLIVGLLQDSKVPINPDLPNGEKMSFVGGSTVIGDLRHSRIRYCIRKSFSARNRLNTQQNFAMNLRDDGSLYLGSSALRGEQLAAIHRGA